MGNLASAVDELLGTDVQQLDDATLIAELVDISREIQRLHAARLERVGVLDARGLGSASPAGSTAGWLRATTRMTPRAASRYVHLARDLVALPAVRSALAAGRLDLDHARVIASLRRDLNADAVAAAEPHLVDAAGRLTAVELRGFVEHVRHSHAADRVVRTEQEQYAERSMSASTTLDGVGVGRWSLPPVSHETVMTAIHAFSAPIPGDDRSPAQRRADALVTIAELALAGGSAPESGGVKPHVTVLLSLETLEGRAGAPAADYGYGASSSSDWARRLCCDAGVSRIVWGPGSEPLDLGRTSRTFTAAQVRAVKARDRHCRWPGCDRPAAWAEVHHDVHWADGGVTSVTNAVLLCGRHHDRVHLHHHRIVVLPDGSRTVDLRPGSARQPSTGPP